MHIYIYMYCSCYYLAMYVTTCSTYQIRYKYAVWDPSRPRAPIYLLIPDVRWPRRPRPKGQSRLRLNCEPAEPRPKGVRLNGLWRRQVAQLTTKP